MKRVSYHIHTLMALKTVLEAQGKVKLDSNVAFRHFEKVNTPTPSTPALQLSMKQKIARSKAKRYKSCVSGMCRPNTDVMHISCCF